MLKITKSKSIPGAKSYFREALQRADYYSENEQTIGTWHGFGAKRLGLSGEVEQKHFFRLLENKTPTGREQLTLRNKIGRVPMFDFTFSATKDLSLLWALAKTDQERIKLVSVHRQAVQAAMKEVERNMEVRVRKGKNAGTQTTRKTGNAIWAEFLHDTSRPVDGVPDPQLHTHAVVINASFDKDEKCFKAAEIGNIKGEAIYYEAVYHSYVAKALSDRGYKVVPDEDKKGRFWKINGLSRDLIAHYSKRTQEIEKTATELGITNDKTKDDLGRRTRQRKTNTLGSDYLFDVWRSQLWPKFEKNINRICSAATLHGPVKPVLNLRSVVRSELAEALRSESVTSHKKLLAKIIQKTAGQYTPPEIKAALEDEDIIEGSVDGRDWITTAEAHRQERSVIGFAKKGLNSRAPLGHGDYHIQFKQINDQQHAAVHHIWNATDRVIILRGGAGVGKTRGVMVDAVAGLQAAGHSVHLFATTLPTTRDLINEGYTSAATIQKLIASEDLQQKVGHNAVIWVEEAGLLDIAAGEKLFDLANHYNWRFVFSGDEKQHKPVKRGDMMRILREEARLPVAEVTEILRQSGLYKQAVVAIEQGDIDKGWTTLEQMGAIVQADGEDRLQTLAKDYLSATKRGENVLVVAPTNHERLDVTRIIRQTLKNEHKIDQKDRSFRFLRNLYFEQHTKHDVTKYKPGMVVRYRYSAKGNIKGGSTFIVEGSSDEGKLYGRNPQGEIIALPLDNPNAFDVYAEETRGFAAGDRVRATEAGYDKNNRKLEKGEFYTIKSISGDGTIELTNEMVIPQSYVFLDHGYSSTSVSAQGLTVDTVLVSMSEQSIPAISKEQFYVSTSRGKRNVRFYVDDVVSIREAAKISGDRPYASQLIKGEIKKDMTRDGKLKAHRQSVNKIMKRLLREQGETTYDASLLNKAGQLAIQEHMGRVHDREADIGER